MQVFVLDSIIIKLYKMSLPKYTLWYLCLVGWGLIPLISRAGDDIQFNTDVLDLKDRDNIDLSQFSRKGFILPGSYSLTIMLNDKALPERTIDFVAPESDPKGSEVCLTPEIVALLGIKESTLSGVTWGHEGECLNINTLSGMVVTVDLGQATLSLSIPQAYLEYSHPDWDPPSRWEEGIPGILFDYNMNLQSRHQNGQGSNSGTDASGNGTTGMNIGAWRLRADWQAQYDNLSGNTGSHRSWDWDRYYAWRALPGLGSKLTIGENYLNSSLFDSFRFTGLGLASDDNMLPPALRGYAPEISGVAHGNAMVIISQQGRILKEVQVAAGPFRIQDLDSAMSGTLDVRVEEQDGSVQTFQVETASIPYLTRPGLVRFKMATGKPSDAEHHASGAYFGSGEFSWGVSNGWSLYGGALGDGDYMSAAIGIGRYLLAFGAISADITHARTRLPQEVTQTGSSYRLSYSKRFDETDSQVTFAGYRFSDSGFMSMNEYLTASEEGATSGRSKELYSVSFSQPFQSAGVNVYLNYSHQTYWNQSSNDRFNLSLSWYFDAGQFRNMNMSLTGYRNVFDGVSDDGMYLSLSLPWGGAAGRVITVLMLAGITVTVSVIMIG